MVSRPACFTRNILVCCPYQPLPVRCSNHLPTSVLRSRHIFGFLHSFYSALPFPLSLPFFSRARLSNTYTSAFPCAYYYSCVLQYKANTFANSPGSILTTTDDGNCILSSTPINWTCRLFYLLQNQSSTI